jgi:CRISPR/Cas system endoribonuclease Cas6 (RAMP superfamily)
MLMSFSSCQETPQKAILECILNASEIDINGVDILVGQVDGWTDTTSLISIVYHKKSIVISIESNLKGQYKGREIYFYQSTVDSLDNRKYKQIPNDIIWKSFIPKELDENSIQPPYNPDQIQIEYNRKKNCFERVIKGKGFISESISKCSCGDVEELIGE